jgi:uncharacterized protein (DUF1810 family)
MSAMDVSLDDKGLTRFLNAQDRGDPASLETALSELRLGTKQEHWIWYVFPQLRGLGHSPHAHYYGIQGLSEAADYLRNPLLRERYQLCLSEILTHLRSGTKLRTILGSTDSLKAISSITLFQVMLKRSGTQDQRLASELLLMMEEFFVLISHDGDRPCQATLHCLE